MTELARPAAEPREKEAPASRTAEGKIEIEASPERVWRALTEAAELERWFPLEARVEPGEGGSIWMSWKNEYAGASKILAWDPPRLLRTTWEGHAHVNDFQLEGRGGKTSLRVVTSGFPLDAAWDEWVEGPRLGWRYELRSLKHYLERHDGENRDVVYLRRRATLSRQESWARLFGPEGFGDRPLGGRPFDLETPRQYAAIVEDPPDAMLRISNEPCSMESGKPDAVDVTLFLAAWGDHGPRLRELEAQWSHLLERLFPEAHTP
jgi:uncharacterized protein YndB with AHSA1/START domain